MSATELEQALRDLEFVFKPTTAGELMARQGWATAVLEKCAVRGMDDAVLELNRLIVREEQYQQTKRVLEKRIKEQADSA